MKPPTKIQIIGIILSLLWMLFAFHSEYDKSRVASQSLADWALKNCIDSAQTTTSSCKKESREKLELHMEGAITNGLLAAVVPLPFFWMYYVITITLVRCVNYGKRHLFATEQMSKLGRCFLYFCYLFCFLNLIFIVAYFLNRHVDSKVPAYLGYSTSVFEQDGYAVVEGTWTKGSALDPKSSPDTPLQVSKIVCHREKMECSESKASILAASTPSLTVDLFDYQVNKWTKDILIYSVQNACSDSIYTIDLNKKSVNGVEKYAANTPNKAYCKKYENDPPTYFKLEDGYTVYSNLRKEASPYLLKLLQAIFGN